MTPGRRNASDLCVTPAALSAHLPACTMHTAQLIPHITAALAPSMATGFSSCARLDGLSARLCSAALECTHTCGVPSSPPVMLCGRACNSNKYKKLAFACIYITNSLSWPPSHLECHVPGTRADPPAQTAICISYIFRSYDTHLEAPPPAFPGQRQGRSFACSQSPKTLGGGNAPRLHRGCYQRLLPWERGRAAAVIKNISSSRTNLGLGWRRRKGCQLQRPGPVTPATGRRLALLFLPPFCTPDG